MGHRQPSRMGAGVLAVAGAVAVVIGALSWPAGAEPAAAHSGSSPGPLSPQPTAVRRPAVVAEPVPAAAHPERPLLATSSANIEDRVVPVKRVPVGLHIDALSVSAPIAPAGALPSDEMEVPDGIGEVAWYRFGPSPGQSGSAVLAAHVDLAGEGPGVFYHLSSLERGDHITVDFDDGSTTMFEVVDGARYHKDELDTARIFARSGPPTLTLITCGGGFNPSLRRYDSNVVVYAVPVSAPEEGAS